jgi:serine/threonine protein phosphatase PrpC
MTEAPTKSGPPEPPSDPGGDDAASAAPIHSTPSPEVDPKRAPQPAHDKSMSFESDDAVTRPGWSGITREVPILTSQASPPEATASVEQPDGITVVAYGLSDTGLVREQNEDNYAVSTLTGTRVEFAQGVTTTDIASAGLVCAVCDGMGGAAAGEVASAIAVEVILEAMKQGHSAPSKDQFARQLVHAVEEAGRKIYKASHEDFQRLGMGTTATVAGVFDSTLFVGQVGDSRAYLFRHEALTPITKDQSLVSQLVETGHLTEEEAQHFEHTNIVLQALGTSEEVLVDLTHTPVFQGDRLLLCSDGLCGLVHTELIESVLREVHDPKECCERLKDLAYSAGGHDNITVVVVEFRGKQLSPPTASDRVCYQPYPLQPQDSTKHADDTRSVRHSKAIEPRSKQPPASSADASVIERALQRTQRAKRPPFARWPFGVALIPAFAGMLMLGFALRQIRYQRKERSFAATTPTTAQADTDAATATHTATDVKAAPHAYIDVQVFCDIPETELWVDGELYGPFPSNHLIYLQLPGGTHRFEARALDDVQSEVTVRLEGNAQSVHLKKP